MKFSKEQGYPLDDPCEWAISINQGQGLPLRTQLKDGINE